tara:strand:- start:456 stop:644 length:189 start_codon:yes stop_codon:yes gene_type:complete
MTIKIKVEELLSTSMKKKTQMRMITLINKENNNLLEWTEIELRRPEKASRRETHVKIKHTFS